MKRFTALFSAMAVTLGLSTADAAFIVEPDNVAPAGKANDHFASLPAGTGFSLTAAASTAAGLTANQTAFGNPANATGPDQYTFRYTPGTDVDNTVYAANLVLGNSAATDADGLGPIAPVYANVNQLATGLTGGASGLYNVYFSTLTSTNVSTTGSQFVVTHDLGTTNLNPVNLNDGGTGPDTTPVGGAHVGGANNMWLKVASLVQLTAGTQYTVTMTANTASFVSQRAAGMMWEFVGLPNSPPTVVDHVDLIPNANEPGDPQTYSHQFVATDLETPLGPFTWDQLQLVSYAPNYGNQGPPPGPFGPSSMPTLSGTGLFNWVTEGNPRGDYVFQVRATDPGGLSDFGTIRLAVLAVPEPTSLALCGLAMVGSLGLARRRNG